MPPRDENYWKDRYQGTWDRSSQREAKLAEYLEQKTGLVVELCGLGAGSTAYIAGSAAKNGHEKGEADLHVLGTNVYIEVTGPLEGNVGPEEPLWFRPDKLDNALANRARGHDVFLAHNCPAARLWRVVHVDEELVRRYRAGAFPVRSKRIRGAVEHFVEIGAQDACIQPIGALVRGILQAKEKGG